MVTTTAGVGVLAIAITPILQPFGNLTAVSIFFAYLSSMLVTPSAVIVWDQLVNPLSETGTDRQTTEDERSEKRRTEGEFIWTVGDATED